MDTPDVANPGSESVVADNQNQEAIEANEVSENLDAEQPDSQEPAGQVQDEEFEDLEHEGRSYKIPKAVKPLMMFERDYRLKTADLAEQRRAVESQIAAHQQDLVGVSRLIGIDEQLNQYTQYFKSPKYQELRAEDPQRATIVWNDYQQLRDTRANLASEMQTRQQQRAAEHERSRATAFSQARAELAKSDPNLGWDGKYTPERIQELDQFAFGAGYTSEQLQRASPRDVKILNLARLGAQFLKQQKAAAKPSHVEAQPVPKVDRGRGNVSSNPADMDMERYAQWRKAGGGGGRR